ncbi:MAG: ATP-binding cassette domain-containing protein [Rhizobium sp.]|nr:ATP-binding cassette domain-containing protein [Rhizobium sp.]
MTVINLRNLGITLGAPLFSNLNLSINAGDRLAVVAANGRGKSTLLRALAGRIEPTTGDITRMRGLTLGFVEQNMPGSLLAEPFYRAVQLALPQDQAQNESWRVDIVLDALGVGEDLRDRPLEKLSGGWQRIALIARVAVMEPDILLLDEPTNHLDLAKIAQVEAWLASLPRHMPAVIASHDRAFLDAVTNRTLFLREETSPDFTLPFSAARAALDQADAAAERRFEKEMKTADQLRRQAAKLNNIGINSGSDLLVVKTKQLRERAARIEAQARPAHRERSAGAIRLANRGTHAKVLISIDDVTVATPDGTALFRSGKQAICQGDRIVLLGPNGAGKTRLVAMLKAAIGTREQGQPGIKVTPSVVLGYGDQALADLGNAETPFNVLNARFELADPRIRSLLAGAGIGLDLQEKPVGNLSGGQKARLGMLVLRLTNPNFYLLDEPTNHLDIEGQEALEDELLETEATSLLVSHDRSFIRNVGNRFWQIEKKKLVEVDDPEAFFAAQAGA